MIQELEALPASMPARVIKMASTLRGKKFKMHSVEATQEVLARRGQSMKEVWNKPGYKAELSAKISRGLNKPEVRAIRSAAISDGKRGTQFFTDTEKRQYKHWIAVIKQCEQQLGDGIIFIGKLAKRERLNPHYLNKFLRGERLEDLE